MPANSAHTGTFPATQPPNTDSGTAARSARCAPIPTTQPRATDTDTPRPTRRETFSATQLSNTDTGTTNRAASRTARCGAPPKEIPLALASADGPKLPDGIAPQATPPGTRCPQIEGPRETQHRVPRATRTPTCPHRTDPEGPRHPDADHVPDCGTGPRGKPARPLPPNTRRSPRRLDEPESPLERHFGTGTLYLFLDAHDRDQDQSLRSLFESRSMETFHKNATLGSDPVDRHCAENGLPGARGDAPRSPIHTDPAHGPADGRPASPCSSHAAGVRGHGGSTPCQGRNERCNPGCMRIFDGTTTGRFQWHHDTKCPAPRGGGGQQQ